MRSRIIRTINGVVTDERIGSKAVGMMHAAKAGAGLQSGAMDLARRYGRASTGTRIADLHGAPVVSAVRAFFGGGAEAAGGGGQAVGGIVLTAIKVSPLLIVGGLILTSAIIDTFGDDGDDTPARNDLEDLPEA